MVSPLGKSASTHAYSLIHLPQILVVSQKGSCVSTDWDKDVQQPYPTSRSQIEWAQ